MTLDLELHATRYERLRASRRTRRRNGLAFAIPSAVIVAVGSTITLLGSGPWYQWAAVGLVLTLVLSSRIGWTMGFVASVLLSIIALGLWNRVTPFMGLELATANAAFWAGLGGLLVVGVAILPLKLQLPTARVWRSVAVVGVVPVLFCLSVAAIIIRHGTSRISWVMHNDAVTSLMFARFVVADRGLNPMAHPNPVALPYTLLAAALAPGRAAASLQHDINRMAGMWILIVLILSIAAAIVGFRSVSASHPILRAIATSGCALVPLTWFVSGFAIEFGFFNANIAIGGLLLAWVAWQEAPRRPRLAFSLLLLSATFLLGSWGPLVAIAVSLALAVLVRERRELSKIFGRRVRVIPLVCVGQLLVVIGVVTVPDYLRDGQNLGANGSIFVSLPAGLVALTLAGVAAAIGVRVLDRRAHPLNGVMAITAAVVPVFGYFLIARAGYDTLWGYYPVKFAWVISIFMLIIAIGLCGELAARTGAQRVMGITVAGLALYLAWVSLDSSVPKELKTFVLSRPATWMALSPLPEIAQGKGVSNFDAQAAALFDVERTPGKPFVTRLDGIAADNFYDTWLLHNQATAVKDPIRYYSYYFSVGDFVDVCPVARLLGPTATLVTRDPIARDVARYICPQTPMTIKIITP